MIRRNLGLAIAASIGVLAAHAMTQPVEAAEAGALEVLDVDVSEHPDIAVTVTGAALSGAELPSGAFSVREDGRAVEAVATRLAVDDLHIVLAIDTSGSMAGPAMPAARDAAARFLDSLPEETWVSIVAFGAQPTVVLPFTLDRGSQHAAVASLTPRGETALYDALPRCSRAVWPAGGSSFCSRTAATRRARTTSTRP
jgi:tight adherence protein B